MLEQFFDILNKDVLFDLSKTRTPDSSKLIIHEDGELSEIKELEIKEIPDDSIAFTLDFSSKRNVKKNDVLFSQLSPYFDKGNGYGVNKSCDLVLISRNGDKFTILIFDQKSKKPDIDSSFIQLENSRLFISYMVDIISLFYDVNVNKEDITFKRVIGTTRVVKTGVNAATSQQEILRRKKLRELGMKEVSIKRTASPEKGWLDYRGIVL
ncbi:TPA: hypothetical protein ACIX09_004499 [Escherichia coli]|uniref:hypothetical protein n=1 Tax=Escherichia coli TaxID=562 RepID=UPI0012FD878E|nr:hypothetical protein [Escherichia coli]EHT7726322.1 hypothetical protein [Escherichia coli]EJK7356865.1 hypothetical protein [Escherichia coli]EKI3795876.1 hypothetical protein [Escherichia coli]MVW21202.1 hypothetical protein [Escherichia coli]